jgi:hypothetical protein
MPVASAAGEPPAATERQPPNTAVRRPQLGHGSTAARSDALALEDIGREISTPRCPCRRPVWPCCPHRPRARIDRTAFDRRTVEHAHELSRRCPDTHAECPLRATAARPVLDTERRGARSTDLERVPSPIGTLGREAVPVRRTDRELVLARRRWWLTFRAERPRCPRASG